MISIVELVIIGFMLFITIFAVVDRICKCVENKANAKAMSQISSPDLINTIAEIAKTNK